MTKLPDLPRPTPAKDAPVRYLEPLDPLMMDAIPKQPKGDGTRTRKGVGETPGATPTPKRDPNPEPNPTPTPEEDDAQAWRGVLFGAALALAGVGAIFVLGKAIQDGSSDANTPDSQPTPRSDAPGRTLE